MKPNNTRHIAMRIQILGVFFCLLFAIIGLKAFHLQVFECKKLSDRAQQEYERPIVSAGKRGVIYDRNLNELAVSIHASSIAAMPSRIENVKKTAKQVAKILNLNEKELYKRLSQSTRFTWIKRQVAPQRVSAVAALDLKGIELVPEFSRFYPHKTLAAQVLGFAGIDSKGLEGIELYYNKEIEGVAQEYKIMKDALGRGFDREAWAEEPPKANNLVLTIDRTIQFIAEEAVKEATVKHEAKSGIAVVMSPQTGELLAIAHYPEFNPNAFTKFKSDAWRNRAVADAFEPGSTMKIFLAAAALESGYCSPKSIFYCENGKYRIGPNVVHDTHSYDWMSIQDIVKHSSNIGAVKIAEMTGKKSLHTSLKSFGFGEKTGVDLPGETAGNLSDYKKWRPIDVGNIAFGQGLSVSAVQLLRAVCAIANGGTLVKPHLAKSVIDSSGNVIRDLTPEKGPSVISRNTAKAVAEMMHMVVLEGGTGTNAALNHYKVCGKTGTAQKFVNGSYATGAFVASFVGFAPQENPAVAVLVVIDEPHQKAHFGGTVAAPAFKKIVYESLNYMAIRPDDMLMASTFDEKEEKKR
jgi:cell division protein FtsI (penicillin-binding protein 3)